MLLEAQWADGMVPHIIFRGDHDGYFPGPDVWSTGQPTPTSGITQPPVAGSILRRLIESGVEVEKDRLAAMVRRLDGWYDWFTRARQCEDSGAILVIHPWESGRDNLSDWDPAMAAVVPARRGAQTATGCRDVTRLAPASIATFTRCARRDALSHLRAPRRSLSSTPFFASRPARRRRARPVRVDARERAQRVRRVLRQLRLQAVGRHQALGVGVDERGKVAEQMMRRLQKVELRVSLFSLG